MAIKHESASEATARGRITARLSADKQELLQLAADLSGSTLNQFVVQSALRAAEQVIEHEEARCPCQAKRGPAERHGALQEVQNWNYRFDLEHRATTAARLIAVTAR